MNDYLQDRHRDECDAEEARRVRELRRQARLRAWQDTQDREWEAIVRGRRGPGLRVQGREAGRGA